MKQYTRTCPTCGTIFPLTYMGWWLSTKRNGGCRSCAGKKTASRPGEKERRSQVLKALYEKDPTRTSGDKNGFYGRLHTNQTKSLLAVKDKSYTKTPTFSKAIKKGMNGKTNRKSTYQCWLERYGQEEADRRMVILRKKHSTNASGRNNHMYGRPAPQGSGNGWKGWYNGVFFRSLRELSFRVTTTQPYRTMETAKDAIPYIWRDVERNYYPDFLVDEKQIVEIKPKRLWNTPLITVKRLAAEEYCRNRGWTYQMIDPDIIPPSTIQTIIQEKRLVFVPKYQIKFEEWVKATQTS